VAGARWPERARSAAGPGARGGQERRARSPERARAAAGNGERSRPDRGRAIAGAGARGGRREGRARRRRPGTASAAGELAAGEFAAETEKKRREECYSRLSPSSAPRSVAPS
jgi:hypothetical protein